jgi:release factor glutamine methyltransferase
VSTAAEGSVTWRTLLVEAEASLRDAGFGNGPQEARWMAERALGVERAGLAPGLDDSATRETAAVFNGMVERRLAGEPLQYVIGRWGFRVVDLHVDPRVLIPRPETEVLGGMALAECRLLDARLAVDLGTGSGALALALAVEWPGIEVWATDMSEEALAVASANLESVGAAAATVQLARGRWFDALPASLAGRVDVILSNPPYVSEDEMRDLPAEVRDWEPYEALCAGPTGLEDIEHIVAEAPNWLARPGTLLLEMAPHHVRRAERLASLAGFPSVTVWPDLAGRDRVLLARM